MVDEDVLKVMIYDFVEVEVRFNWILNNTVVIY